ncbi:MAG: hypothetical protein J7J92_00525 [Candidatus Aenigmarchaeota archaeon]|nr:hypothetical protein [Candidatus Aenigmarchaeota archaeon]
MKFWKSKEEKEILKYLMPKLVVAAKEILNEQISDYDNLAYIVGLDIDETKRTIAETEEVIANLKKEIAEKRAALPGLKASEENYRKKIEEYEKLKRICTEYTKKLEKDPKVILEFLK